MVLPARPSSVSVGEEEAGDTCTTFAGAVTEVRIGIETDEMMPPMIAGVFWSLHELIGDVDRDAARALRIAGVGESWQPRTPPAALMSRNAISTDFSFNDCTLHGAQLVCVNLSGVTMAHVTLNQVTLIGSFYSNNMILRNVHIINSFITGLESNEVQWGPCNYF